MRRIYYGIVSCCFITMCVLTVQKSMLSQHTNAMQFISKLETLALDETTPGTGTGESGNSKACTTYMSSEIIQQTCGTMTFPVRTTIKYHCSEGDYGYCQEGEWHTFYDCSFLIIGENNNIKDKLCY